MVLETRPDVLLALAFVVMLASNVLSTKRAFGRDNKEISDSNPTFVTPDGKTFAVWGIIYMLEIGLTVAQFWPSEHTAELLEQKDALTGLDVRGLITLAFLANALWLPFWGMEWLITPLLVIIAYLAALFRVYLEINPSTTQGPLERIVYGGAISANLSWIVVATIANLFNVLRKLGWQDANGVGGSPVAAKAVVVVVVALACHRALTSCDLAYSLVAAWALSGINRMQTVPDKVRFPLLSLNASLASWARAGAATVLVASVAGVVLAV